LFGTYAAVYLAAHPSEGPGVTTYMIRVLELSRQYEDGVYLRYDTLFRKLKAKAVTKALPWLQISTSVLMDCLQGRGPLVSIITFA
jgi:hypothetical protein